MIGLDTNVLIRYLTHDDPDQTVAATTFMNSLSSDSPGFLSLIAIVELVWVLSISYDFRKKEIELVIETLLRSQELIVERSEIVAQALRAFRSGRGDFAHYLIERCGYAASCQYTVTFDQKAARVPGMRLL